MKVVITSKGNSFDAELDGHFARCAFFVIYDIDSEATEFIPNPYKEMENGAGPASVQLLVERNISKIIAGEFGIKIKTLLDSLKIQMIVIKNKKIKVKEIIQLLNH